MGSPTSVAYVELANDTDDATSSIYVKKLWQNGRHAQDIADGGHLGAGVLRTGGGRAAGRWRGAGHRAAPQGSRRPGPGETGVAAVQFGCGRGVQLRLGRQRRVERIDCQPSPFTTTSSRN